MNSLNLRQLSAFVTVARLGSFTRAAEALNVSQPALTVQVRKIEEYVGLKLLDRSTHQVALSPAGRDLFPILQRLLEELEDALSPMKRQNDSLRGRVRIGCFPSVATYLLPSIIQEFSVAHPEVKFLLRDTAARRVVELIQREEVDFGIVDGVPDAPDIESQPLFDDHLHAVFLRGDPIGDLDHLTTEALADRPLILLDPQSHVRRIVDGVFLQSGRLVEPICEVTYMQTAIGMVRAGLGVAVLPALAATVENSHISSRPIDHPSFSRRLDLVMKRGKTRPPASDAFVRFLIARTARLRASGSTGG